jgi:hypothetical protein
MLEGGGAGGVSVGPTGAPLDVHVEMLFAVLRAESS